MAVTEHLPKTHCEAPCGRIGIPRKDTVKDETPAVGPGSRYASRQRKRLLLLLRKRMRLPC